MKLSFPQLLKSKTFWTMVGMTAYNVVGTQIAPTIAANTPVGMGINMGLLIAGSYFRKLNTQLPPAASDKIEVSKTAF